MPHVVFAPHLRRHVDAPPVQVPAGSLREVLDAAFEQAPRLRDYVLDEQGAVRRHVMVFVNGRRVRDRSGLSDRLESADELQIFQALTGG